MNRQDLLRGISNFEAEVARLRQQLQEAEARIRALEEILDAVPHLSRVGVCRKEYGDRCSPPCPRCATDDIRRALLAKEEAHE